MRPNTSIDGKCILFLLCPELFVCCYMCYFISVFQFILLRSAYISEVASGCPEHLEELLREEGGCILAEAASYSPPGFEEYKKNDSSGGVMGMILLSCSSWHLAGSDSDSNAMSKQT